MSECEFLTAAPNRRGLQLYLPISLATDVTLGIDPGDDVLAQITPAGGVLLTPSDELEAAYPQQVPAPPPSRYREARDAADLATHAVPSFEDLAPEGRMPRLND